MADLISSRIDSALHDLEYLAHASRFEGYSFQPLRLRLRNLKRFVRTCGNQGSSTSLLVWIAETVRRNAEQLYSQGMVLEFEGAIISMKGRIDQWLDDREPGTSCIPDDVLENISSISEALLDVRSAMVWPKTENLQEIMDALEEQLSFMKRLISYLATRISAGSICDLLAHSESLTVNATNLLVTFENWGDFESKLSIYLQKLEPVYETYTQSLSSLKLEGRFLGSTQVMGGGAFNVMKDFLDSLVSNIWDLLRLNSCELSVKDLPELYGGLRSLRTALKQRQFDNLSVKIKEDTEDAVCDAGVFICSLHHTLLAEVDVGLLKNLFDTINTILSEIGAQEPQEPILNFPGQEDRFYTRIKEDVLRTSPEGSEKQFDVKKLPPEGASSSTNEEEMQLVDQLTRGSMQLQIVAIVGMPGLGKTTLATKVYNNPFVSFHFHIRALCPLSHVVDEKKVLLDLLNQIDPRKYSMRTTEQDLAHTLRRNLNGRKYLIFLDDVWDLAAWTLFKELFPDNNVGSRIMLTSRRHDVAPPNLMVDGRPYFLRQLSEDESLELLQSKLSFGLSLDLGMKIAEKCNGLPLIVVIVAGVLKHAEPAGWDELLDCLSNASITEQFTNTLELSYNQLPAHLRPCPLYFGIFPENKKISVRKLLRLWTAEGFIQGENMHNLDDAAEHCLNDLIARSLIMVAEQKSLGGVKACRIHDLVHDFCLRKAKDEHFFHFLRGYDELSAFSEPNDLQRLCIHSEAEHFKQSRLFCPLARSLILNSSESTERLVEGIVCYISSPFHIFKRLTVLDLEQVHFGYRFPKEIRQLVQLTFLAILSEAWVVPSWIGNLLNLETLIVLGDSSGILPHSLWDLQKLQYLYFGGIGYLLPTESLDRPFALQELVRISGVVIPSRNMESLLRKFPNVRRLKFRLHGRDDSYNLLVPNILSRLQSLTVSPGPSTELGELSFPANLKKLTLGRFVLSQRNIATIGELPNLEVFKLLRTKFEGNTWKMEEGEFSKLKFLKLVGLALVRWYAEDDQLDFLQKLVLEDCSILKEVPSCLDSIPTLEVIELFNCRFTVIDLVKRIEGRRNELMGDSGLKIIVNNVSPYSFPK